MEYLERLNKIGRRSFLKLGSLVGIAGVVSPSRSAAKLLLTNSRVIILTNSAATTGTVINAPVVQNMVDGGICSLAQIGDVGEAWKSLLPGVNAGSRIAIKVNCINSAVPTHPQVTNAVAETLKRMMFNGNPFPENNIIIYDWAENELQASGYTINTGTTGVRCLGSNTGGVGYTSQVYDVSGWPERLSRIVTDMCDYLVNIAVLKNHDQAAGVTLCMKNNYGSCDAPGNIHWDYCDPGAPALNALPEIRAKQKVHIIDALFGVRSGGPGGPPQFRANKLIMSTDIVATDYWGRKLLQDNGCTTTGVAHYIDTAAAAPYSLGTNDPALMDVIYLTGILPIQLSRFVAALVSPRYVRLDWTTISETNNYGFDVQRRTVDQTDYETLLNSFIAGHGTTLEPHSYTYLDTTSIPGRLWYRLKQTDQDGTVYFTEPIAIDVLTGVKADGLPSEFALLPNYPNPFNPTTNIKYQTPEVSHVTVKVFDLAGREVTTLVDGIQEPGFKSVSWNAGGSASGVYTCRMQAGTFVQTRKMVVLK